VGTSGLLCATHDGGLQWHQQSSASRDEGGALRSVAVMGSGEMSDFATTDFGYRFKFQSNLVWDSIKSISNFCFQF
jgi:hypothetical protein